MNLKQWFRWIGHAVAPQSFLPVSEVGLEWDLYLERLYEIDRENVQEVCRRLRQYSQQVQLPLAVMAVGSVLYKPRGTYNDVDLLILPLRFHDLPRGERLLADFITQQPEVIRETVGALAGQPKETTWRSLHCYDLNRYWNLSFSKGKVIQLFIATQERLLTLEQQLLVEIDNKSYLRRKLQYAYIILE